MGISCINSYGKLVLNACGRNRWCSEHTE
ncbi:uncharacterized protein METZ01_LOCUS119997, partial [marine metagenome]